MKLVITGEMVAWLKDGYPRWRVAELTERFNRRFGTDAKKRQIKDAMYRRRISAGRKAGPPKGANVTWRPELIAWLREHRGSGTLEELAPKLNARFGTDFKPHSIQAACKRYDIGSSSSKFKAGDSPWNKGVAGATPPPARSTRSGSNGLDLSTPCAPCWYSSSATGSAARILAPCHFAAYENNFVKSLVFS